MDEFDVTHWSDYVRGLGDPETRALQAAHLGLPGSARARGTVEAFSALLDFGHRDAAAEPPAAALRNAKLLGSLLRPAAGWRQKLLSLVFDSAATPLAFGVRGLAAAADDRQLIYQADDYLVDLRLERDPPSGSWVVVGQLLCERGEIAPLTGVQVFAASEDRFVGRTRTGHLGEFQADGLPSADLRLLFLVSNEVCLEVPVSSDLPDC